MLDSITVLLFLLKELVAGFSILILSLKIATLAQLSSLSLVCAVSILCREDALKHMLASNDVKAYKVKGH
jgi:hypothetical protein